MSVAMVDTDGKNFENPAYEAGEHPAATSVTTATTAPVCPGTNKVSKQRIVDSAHTSPRSAAECYKGQHYQERTFICSILSAALVPVTF